MSSLDLSSWHRRRRTLCLKVQFQHAGPISIRELHGELAAEIWSDICSRSHCLSVWFPLHSVPRYTELFAFHGRNMPSSHEVLSWHKMTLASQWSLPNFFTFLQALRHFRTQASFRDFFFPHSSWRLFGYSDSHCLFNITPSHNI